MKMLEQTSIITGLHPAFLFKLACDNKEIRKHPRNMKHWFQELCEDGVFPDFVHDFCLDVMAKRIKVPTKDKKLPP